jgi:hypothetical protein
MTSLSKPQLTLNFEPALPERFPSLRKYIAFRVQTLPKAAQAIAADMDLSPSTLSRKLNPTDTDTQRFNLDDLEGYLASTGDVAAVIEYLAAKYMDSDKARHSRMLAKVEAMLPELSSALAALKAAGADA